MSLTGTATPDETAELLAFFTAPAQPASPMQPVSLDNLLALSPVDVVLYPPTVPAVSTAVITPIPADPLQVRNSEDAREKIIELLASGKFLREIARMPGMPSTQAIRNWRKADPDFDKEIEAARLEGCDVMAESCLQIADDGTNDYVDEDGVRRVDTDHIQRSKLRVDTRLRLLEKMHPRKYGAKVDVNHGGQEGNPVRLIAANMTQEESTQLYSEMLKVGR